ncbi:MAG: Bacterial rane protein YfhO [Acidobacteria bacterium]|nr:Bacterial rane protein YfhO [Acidobacteriota bacterium]
MTGRAVLTGRLVAPIEMAYMTEPLHGMKNANGVGGMHNGVLLDVAFQMIPWRAAVRESLAHREWPLVNRSILGGDILAAAAQPAAYSPITWIACLLPAAESFNISTYLTLFLASLGAFLFAAELGCGEAAALFAAIGWMLSTPVSTFAMWPLGATWALLPSLLLATRRTVRTPSFANSMLLMLVLTLATLSGHPESLLHVIAFGAAYGVFELWIASDRRRAAVTAIVSGIVALALSAIYLLPVIDALRQTEEHAFRQRVYATSARSDRIERIAAGAAVDLFPFLEGRTWRAPALRNLPNERMAVGSIVVVLALLGAFTIRSREKWFFTIAFVVCALAALKAPPVSTVLHALPLFDVALNERLAFAAAFCLVMLAALAARDDAPRFVFVIALLVIGAASLVANRFVLNDAPSWASLRLFAELAPLAAVALMPRKGGILLAALLIQRTLEQGFLYPANARDAAYPKIAILAPLADIREPFRIVGTGMTFLPNTATLYGLEDARGYEAMTFRPLAETYPLWCARIGPWFNRVDDLSRPFLAMMNVRFALTKASDPIPPGWREVAADRTGRLIENPAALPRAFIPKHVRINAPNELAEMQSATDFGERSWLAADVPSHERDNGPGTIVSMKRRTLGWRIDADMERDGWIVVSQTAWNGWRAYVDGRRIRYQLANHAFLGVHLPHGRHSVRLTYLPESFVAGRAISFATLACIVALVIVRRRRSGVN